jgi:hypothetical protein
VPRRIGVGVAPACGALVGLCLGVGARGVARELVVAVSVRAEVTVVRAFVLATRKAALVGLIRLLGHRCLQGSGAAMRLCTTRASRPMPHRKSFFRSNGIDRVRTNPIDPVQTLPESLGYSSTLTIQSPLLFFACGSGCTRQGQGSESLGYSSTLTIQSPLLFFACGSGCTRQGQGSESLGYSSTLTIQSPLLLSFT